MPGDILVLAKGSRRALTKSTAWRHWTAVSQCVRSKNVPFFLVHFSFKGLAHCQPRVFSNDWCRERLLLWQRKLSQKFQLLSSKQFQAIRALSFSSKASKASAPVNFMDLVKDFNEGLGQFFEHHTDHTIHSVIQLVFFWQMHKSALSRSRTIAESRRVSLALDAPMAP